VSDRTALKPNPLKVEGRIVPVMGKIDDSSFRFSMHPSEFVEYVKVKIIGSTSDFKIASPLLGEDIGSFKVDDIQVQYPPVATIFVDIQRVNYKRPEMQHYPAGSLFQEGTLELEGILLSKEPEQVISLTDLVKYLNLNKVREVDYDSPDGIGRERAEV
jgi:hypothetical protein